MLANTCVIEILFIERPRRSFLFKTAAPQPKHAAFELLLLFLEFLGTFSNSDCFTDCICLTDRICHSNGICLISNYTCFCSSRYIGVGDRDRLRPNKQ